MAEELVDGEFWLPSEFLTDDDILLDMDLSSLSTEPETETEEDDIHLPAGSSPKSTLFGYYHGSNLSTPIMPISPPKKLLKIDESATLDLLNKAAGEVAKMTSSVGTGFFDCSNTAKRPLYPPTTNPAPLYYSHPQFRQFPPHMMWAGGIQFPAPQQQNMVAKNNSSNNNNNNGLLGLPQTAWPPLSGQAQPPTQPKFVVSKRESVGTGVFFPRRVPSNTDTKKKSDENVTKTKKNKGSQQRNTHPAKAIHREEIELPSEWVY